MGALPPRRQNPNDLLGEILTVMKVRKLLEIPEKTSTWTLDLQCQQPVFKKTVGSNDVPYLNFFPSLCDPSVSTSSSDTAPSLGLI